MDNEVETTAIARVETNQPSDITLSVDQLVDRVNLIQKVMKGVMKENEHYGKIPGCGDKPTLLKPGAEKLTNTFQLFPKYDIERIDHPRGHREYEITCSLLNSRGEFRGQGVGNCSTLESKFRYRNAVEVTDQLVPKAYWNLRNSDPKKAIDLLGGKGHGVQKVDGSWFITNNTGEKVEHPDPADYYNTVKKMAKKRALVDATLTATGASDIFAQDLEDLPDTVSPSNATRQDLEGEVLQGQWENQPASSSAPPKQKLQSDPAVVEAKRRKLARLLYPDLAESWPPKKMYKDNFYDYDVSAAGKMAEPMTDSQRGMLMQIFPEIGYGTDEDRHALIKILYFIFDIDSTMAKLSMTEFTKGHASFFIDILNSKNPVGGKFNTKSVNDPLPWKTKSESTESEQVPEELALDEQDNYLNQEPELEEDILLEDDDFI